MTQYRNEHTPEELEAALADVEPEAARILRNLTEGAVVLPSPAIADVLAKLPKFKAVRVQKQEMS